MELKYTHLHLHTEYSLLDGANRIEELAIKIKKLGMKSVAMTDHGNMSGAIVFYNTMKKYGIKPIIGMEAYIHNREDISSKLDRTSFHVCLYAKDLEGYKNLMELSSIANERGFYYKPRINIKELKKRKKGLICSSACLQGEIAWNLNMTKKNVERGAGGYEAAKEAALKYKKIFGKDFYIELMRHGISNQFSIDKKIVRIGQETEIKIIGTNDTHYNSKEDGVAHEAFMCIAMNKMYDDPNRMKHSVHEFYIKSPEEMYMLFADMPEVLKNTNEIANKCNLEIPLGEPIPPKFKFARKLMREYKVKEVEKQEYSYENDKKIFQKICEIGLENVIKDKENKKEYKDRLKYEMKIIKEMKFSGYMLLVRDFIQEARSRNIPVGPGRGSAAGSLVCYSLNITEVDPVKYGLLFERFLNVERISMPDIDIDFCQSRRQEIIEYVFEKYGKQNVCQITTFTRMLAKGVIRDVARVLGVPYAKANAMAKIIPEELGITLNEAKQKDEKVRIKLKQDSDFKRVWKFATTLEGLIRNAGTHAAGLIVSDEPVRTKCPTARQSNSDIQVTQYEGKYVEDVGLIKFDFLGLKTLTVIQKTIDLIGNKNVMREMDVNDPKIYKDIKKGENSGIFQLESEGMNQLAVDMKPEKIEELAAMIALYRPGPLESGMTEQYVKNKGRKIKTEFKEIEGVLKETYGVIVYQEQVIKIVQILGGLSGGRADIIRKAMGKKDKEQLEGMKKEFVKGAVKKGHNKKKIEKLFDKIMKFAGYGFNKSHSYAYAMISIQTAFLKTYYPKHFMAALMSLDKSNEDKIREYIAKAKKIGIKILKPTVDGGKSDFTVNEKGIVFGLGAIKGLGEVAAKELERGSIKKLEDLGQFTNMKKITRTTLMVLIKSGALRHFKMNSKEMIENVDEIKRELTTRFEVEEASRGALLRNKSLEKEIKVDKLEEYSKEYILKLEKEVLGIYISENPLEELKKNYKQKTDSITDIKKKKKQRIRVIVSIDSMVKKISKKGNPYGNLMISDSEDSLNLLLFESDIERIEEVGINKPVIMSIFLQERDGSKTYRFKNIEKIGMEKIERIDSREQLLRVAGKLKEGDMFKIGDIDFRLEW